MYPLDLITPERRVTEYDGLRPTGFRVSIAKLPQVSFFTQKATLPEIALGTATSSNPFLDLNLPGEKLTYKDLVLTFMVQENLQNYLELYTWLVTLGFPENRAQYGTKIPTARIGTSSPERKTDSGDYSDAILSVLGSDNNEVAQFRFIECFPVSLSSLEFDATDKDAAPLQAVATFKYRSFVPHIIARTT